MGSTVVVTGTSRLLGVKTAERLARSPEVETVIGVDSQVPPHAVEGVQFVRMELVGPAFGRLLAQTRADTVVHLSVSHEAVGGDRRLAQKESNVIGSLRLLAGVQSSSSVKRVVLKSTGAVYGSSPTDPAYFVESSAVRGAGVSASIADALEVEKFVRGVATRRPDLTACVLRMAHVVGHGMRTAFLDYVGTPLVPVPFGFDPRIQVLHMDDAVEALVLAATGMSVGTFNIAGDGALPLSAVIRRLGGQPLPVLPGTRRLARLIPGVGRNAVAGDVPGYLRYGRVLDTRAMRAEFGFTPTYSTSSALDALATERALAADEQDTTSSQDGYPASQGTHTHHGNARDGEGR